MQDPNQPFMPIIPQVLTLLLFNIFESWAIALTGMGIDLGMEFLPDYSEEEEFVHEYGTPADIKDVEGWIWQDDQALHHFPWEIPGNPGFGRPSHPEVGWWFNEQTGQWVYTPRQNLNLPGWAYDWSTIPPRLKPGMMPLWNGQTQTWQIPRGPDFVPYYWNPGQQQWIPIRNPPYPGPAHPLYK